MITNAGVMECGATSLLSSAEPLDGIRFLIIVYACCHNVAKLLPEEDVAGQRDVASFRPHVRNIHQYRESTWLRILLFCRCGMHRATSRLVAPSGEIVISSGRRQDDLRFCRAARHKLIPQSGAAGQEVLSRPGRAFHDVCGSHAGDDPAAQG
jgi:hypothetical protein